MPDLLVRNVDKEVVKALKKRAGLYGRSAEAEHRLILIDSLLKPRKKSFAEVLQSMPNVGKDSDFSRVQETSDADVFD
ncbi:MAG: hypothetical protein NPIRA04_17800 [Nitrospirales bacterium]|nr:MAG: hypothetical protein NPIRA04_17800 [Nitrospirales bacterium]